MACGGALSQKKILFRNYGRMLAQGGILSIDTAPGSPSLLATAGADGAVVLFDRDAGRIRAALTGHSKRVNSARAPLWPPAAPSLIPFA